MRLASRSASMPFRRALSACLRQRRAFMPTRSIACGHGWKPQSAELDLRAAIHHHLQPCRSEEHTSELQSLMRISYAVFCLKKKKTKDIRYTTPHITDNTSINVTTTH